MELPEQKPTEALTLGAIARRWGVPQHRVAYVVLSRGLKPTGRAGIIRIFSEADCAFIGSELKRIDADKGGVS